MPAIFRTGTNAIPAEARERARVVMHAPHDLLASTAAKITTALSQAGLTISTTTFEPGNVPIDGQVIYYGREDETLRLQSGGFAKGRREFVSASRKARTCRDRKA
jgi:hypothetical protein